MIPIVPLEHGAARASRVASRTLALLCLALPLGGAAEEDARPMLRGFEPALTLGFGVHSQDLSGTQSSNFAGPLPGREGSLRGSFAEGEAVLFSPTLTETLGLRVFFRGGGSLPFTSEQLAHNSLSSFDLRLNNPQPTDANCADLPRPTPPNTVPSYTAGFCSIRGRNEIIVNGAVFAGLGIDLTLPILSRQFHLRPSLNYYAQNIEGEGLTTRLTTAEEPINCTPGSPSRNGMTCIDPVRPGTERYEVEYNQNDFTRGSASQKWVHGLGPRLELAVEVAKVGDVLFEFFAQTGIYWLLTDRALEFQAIGRTGTGFCTQRSPPDLTIVEPQFCPPPHESDDAFNGSYRSKVGPVVVQGGGGLRLVWRGFAL